jgi:hypothetical protein
MLSSRAFKVEAEKYGYDVVKRIGSGTFANAYCKALYLLVLLIK